MSIHGRSVDPSQIVELDSGQTLQMRFTVGARHNQSKIHTATNIRQRRRLFCLMYIYSFKLQALYRRNQQDKVLSNKHFGQPATTLLDVQMFRTYRQTDRRARLLVGGAKEVTCYDPIVFRLLQRKRMERSGYGCFQITLGE